MRITAVLLLANAAMAADPSVQQLFEQVRDKVLDNTRRVPRYTCVQTIDRDEYHPQSKTKPGAIPAGCEAVIAARGKLASPGDLTWRDRLRLDVAVLNGKETFAWAGARQFETTDIAQLTSSGAWGSGDFASFLAGVFGIETTRISLMSEEKSPTVLSALFAFDVPVDRAHYVYRRRGIGEQRVIGYHGTFLVDERLAELKRLSVEADHFPADEDMCRVNDVMDYHRVKIGDGDFLLPETSKMTVLFNDGQESQNETRYSNCREYVGESTISFDKDDPAAGTPTKPKTTSTEKVPPNLRLQLALKSPIHSETAAAGDEVTAVVLRDVKGLARANDIVHGRILRLEQSLLPFPRWVVAIRFNRIEHNGVEQTLDLMPMDDGDRARRNTILTEKRPPGAGLFIFRERGKLVLDRNFHSEWETR
jgi:hypothetical protein